MPGRETGQHAARRQQRRDQRTDPAALVGGDELLHQRQIDRENAGVADTDEEAEEHQEQPSRDEAVLARRENHDTGGERDGDRRQDEHRAAADPVAKPPPEEGARNRAETGGEQDRPALPIGQRPLLGQRCGDVPDQKEIKKVEQICQVRRADQLPLVDRQLLLLFQELDHDVPPLAGGRRNDEPMRKSLVSRAGDWKCPAGGRKRPPMKRSPTL